MNNSNSDQSRSDSFNSDKSRWITIDYTNYKGVRSTRTIIPHPAGLTFGSTQYHPEPQWLLAAWDVEKGAERTFAVKDVHGWQPVDEMSEMGKTDEPPRMMQPSWEMSERRLAGSLAEMKQLGESPGELAKEEFGCLSEDSNEDRMPFQGPKRSSSPFDRFRVPKLGL